MDISYLCDPFRDLADLGIRLLKGESPLEVEFTDEEFDLFLRCEQHHGKCHLTLNCPGRSHRGRRWNRPRRRLRCEVDPRVFARMLWQELSRMSQDPEARNFWQTQHAEERFRWHYPDAMIAELEKALMG